MKLRVLPYKAFSKSAKALVNSLRPLAMLKKQNTSVKGRKKVLLNWGHSNPLFDLTGVTVLNKPSAVALASNKLTALQTMRAAGVSVPDFSDNIEDAKQWIDEERIVLCRKLLRANSGKGIVIAKEEDELVPAPLYVKYIRKEKEYRLHVFNGEIIDMIEKKRKSGFMENGLYNRYIRSYEQGWVFTRDGIEVNLAAMDMAIKACNALGLDFGAVDLVMDKRNNPVVLEVNTAPGLQGTTLEVYKQAVQNWIENVSST